MLAAHPQQRGKALRPDVCELAECDRTDGKAIHHLGLERARDQVEDGGGVDPVHDQDSPLDGPLQHRSPHLDHGCQHGRCGGILDNVTDDGASLRKRKGVAGAMLAGAMIAVRDILEAPKDDEAVIIEASSEPEDIDEGMNFVVDPNTIAYTPPLPRHRSQRDSGAQV